MAVNKLNQGGTPEWTTRSQCVLIIMLENKMTMHTDNSNLHWNTKIKAAVLALITVFIMKAQVSHEAWMNGLKSSTTFRLSPVWFETSGWRFEWACGSLNMHCWHWPVSQLGQGQAKERHLPAWPRSPQSASSAPPSQICAHRPGNDNNTRWFTTDDSLTSLSR